VSAAAAASVIRRNPRSELTVIRPIGFEAASPSRCCELAARIRETAWAAGVPVHRDAPTARALHGTVEIGAEIAPQHYRAVAAAIRFADDMRARRKAQHGSHTDGQ